MLAGLCGGQVVLAEAHAPPLQLISISGQQIGTFVNKPLHFLLVPALRGSGRFYLMKQWAAVRTQFL